MLLNLSYLFALFSFLCLVIAAPVPASNTAAPVPASNTAAPVPASNTAAPVTPPNAAAPVRSAGGLSITTTGTVVYVNVGPQGSQAPRATPPDQTPMAPTPQMPKLTVPGLTAQGQANFDYVVDQGMKEIKKAVVPMVNGLSNTAGSVAQEFGKEAMNALANGAIPLPIG